MSYSVRPQRQQPTRLPYPWDSPGKNTGVGCHFLLQCMKVKSESEVSQSCLTLSDPTDCSLPGSSIHGIFQAKVLEWVAIAFSKESWAPKNWHFWLDDITNGIINGHELEQAPGVGDGQGSLACFSPWDPKESDMTEWLNWTELNCVNFRHTSACIHLLERILVMKGSYEACWRRRRKMEKSLSSTFPGEREIQLE